jgi:hypothetical protein
VASVALLILVDFSNASKAAPSTISVSNPAGKCPDPGEAGIISEVPMAKSALLSGKSPPSCCEEPVEKSPFCNFFVTG